MTDIVERYCATDEPACLADEFRAENERLRADKLHWEHQNGILEADIERLRAALKFYADPQSYHAIAFLVDRPAGGFADDFDDEHGDEFYERPMPGKTARRALEGERSFRCSCQIANRVSDECERLGKCKERGMPSALENKDASNPS